MLIQGALLQPGPEHWHWGGCHRCQAGDPHPGLQWHPGQALRDRQELEEQPHLLWHPYWLKSRGRGSLRHRGQGGGKVKLFVNFVKYLSKVRELIKRKLRITREIPFNRVSRVFHGPEFRGQKPVQVSSLRLSILVLAWQFSISRSILPTTMTRRTCWGKQNCSKGLVFTSQRTSLARWDIHLNTLHQGFIETLWLSLTRWGNTDRSSTSSWRRSGQETRPGEWSWGKNVKRMQTFLLAKLELQVWQALHGQWCVFLQWQVWSSGEAACQHGGGRGV